MGTRWHGAPARHYAPLLSSWSKQLIGLVSILAIVVFSFPEVPGPAGSHAAAMPVVVSRHLVTGSPPSGLATSTRVSSRPRAMGPTTIDVAALRMTVSRTTVTRLPLPVSSHVRRILGAVGPAPLPPLAPSLNPEPVHADCLFWRGPGLCYYILRPGFLTFTASPHILHVGHRLSGNLHFYAPRFSGWGWDKVAPGLREISHCPQTGPGNVPVTVTCTWEAVAPTNGWVIFGPTLSYVGSNDYQAGSFYTVVDTNTIVLDGSVRDDAGNPITQTNVILTGPRTYRAVTNLDGRYDAILPKGRYTVTPQVNPDLMAPGEHVKPVRSAGCTPSGSSCIVQLTDNRTADFIVPACHIKPDTILDWKVEGKCPTHMEDGAADVKITPPTGLPGGLKALIAASSLVTDNHDGTYTLAYKLPMKDHQHLLLPVVLPDFGVTIGSLSVAAYGNTLDESGLASDTAGVTLSSGVQAIANDLRVGPGGLSAGSLALAINGTTVDAQDVQMSSGGLSANSATIGLPPILGGSSATVSGFSIGADGSVHGTLSGFRLQVGDLYGDVTGMTFLPQGGLSLDSATLHLPIAGTKNGGEFTIGGLTYNNGTITLKNASALVHVSFGVGNVNVDGQGQFTLSASGTTVQYGFNGTAMVSIPGVFTAHATLEIGPEDSAHPSRFHQAAFDATLNHGVPLGNTGLELTSVGGSLSTSGTKGHVIYTFGLSGGVTTAFDQGNLFNGTDQGILATDGNVGLGLSSGTLLRKIQVTARLCARFNTEDDSVCTQMLPDHPEIRTAVGAFVEATGTLNATVFGYGAGLSLTAYGQVQPTSIEATITGTAQLTLPGWAAQGTLVGQFGRFQGPTGSVLGIKATLNGAVNTTPPQAIARSLFVDQYGSVISTGVESYTLVQAAPGAAQIVRMAAALRDGAPAVASAADVVQGPGPAAPRATIRAAAPTATNTPLPTTTATPIPTATNTPLPSATPTPAPIIATLRIPRGQTDTLVSLTWQAGAPTLTLIAPNGRRVTLAHPGSGAYLVTTGTATSVTFYLPHPQAGRWRLRIDNIHGGEGYRLSAQGNAPQPVLTVSTPHRGQTIVASAAHPRVSLGGTLRGGPGTATVALYYTGSATIGQGRGRTPNYAGTLLAARVPVRRGAWRYTWDTGTLPAGRYDVYATLNNGTGPLVTGYGAGAILVRQPARPDAPRRVRGLQRVRTLTVQWQAPARAGLVHGYVVRWRPQGLRDEPWVSVNAGTVRRVVLSPTRTDVRYAVEVASYDVAGHQSPWATARMSGGPRARPALKRPPVRHHSPVRGGRHARHGQPGRAQAAAAASADHLSRRGRGSATAAAPLLNGAWPFAPANGRREPARAAQRRTGTSIASARPRRAEASILPVPIFMVTDSATPQIAYNDAAAIDGIDPSTGKPARTVSGGVYVAYKRRASSIVHYGPYTTEGRVSRKNRQAACGAKPFRTGGKPGPTDGPSGTWTSCDEYPFASTTEGGGTALIRGVAILENLTQGGQLSAFLQKNANALAQHDGEFKVCVLVKGHESGTCS